MPTSQPLSQPPTPAMHTSVGNEPPSPMPPLPIWYYAPGCLSHQYNTGLMMGWFVLEGFCHIQHQSRVIVDWVNQIQGCLSSESKKKIDQEDNERVWNSPLSFTLYTPMWIFIRLSMMKARKITTDHNIERQDRLHWYDRQFIYFKDIIVKDG